MLQGVKRRADHLVGNLIETAIRGRHRRRLTKLGHRESILPGPGLLWAGGDPPPRAGNSLDVLIDGESVLPAIEEAISGARHHVHIAGWSITPGFALTRGDQPAVVKALLAEVARRADVRVLLWAGAPVPVMRPARRDVRQVRDALVRGSGVRVALDTREHLIHCHHEKIVVVDDEVAFVGGIDLTDSDGDRYDLQDHPYRKKLGWHDLAFRIRGPLVADAARHFLARWHEVTGERLPPPATSDPAGQVEAQFVRTVPEKVYSFAPRGEFRILESYLRAINSAQKLIYIENQFLWAPEIVWSLTEKLRQPPSPDFRVVVILPSRANQGEEDTRGMLQVLEDADAGAGRFAASTISAMESDEVERVYVHAKVAVIDDRWLTIGSANLNGRGLFNDTEANVVTHNPRLARQTRLRLWSEHLGLPIEEVDGDPAEVIDRLWLPTARDQLHRIERGESRTHRLVELPASSRRAERLLGALEGLVVDG
jgi:phosphatidylserine/phosphatidylglycerophosphate/cardiolipin synthase-like enzyme